MARARSAVVVALGTALGLELLRVFIPSVAWYLRDTKHVPTLQLIPWALAPFLLAFALPLVRRALGARTLAGVGVALCAVRLVEQVATTPVADLWLGLVGVTLWLWFTAEALASFRNAFAPGLMLGFALDTAIRALGRTLDLSWIEQGWALALVVILCVAAAVLFVTARPGRPEPVGWAAVGLAPLLFLELIVLQIPAPEAPKLIPSLTAIAAGNIAAVWAATVGARRITFLTVLAAAGLPFFAAAWTGGVLSGLLIGVVAGAYAFWLFSPRATDARPAWLVIAIAGVGFVGLALAYYLSLDINLGIGQDQIRLGVLPGLLVLAGVLSRAVPAEQPGDRPPTVMALVLALAVFASVGFDGSPRGDIAGQTLRVMTYNIHSAYDTQGRQDPEDIARVIEGADVDVVALQEVSRGWLLDGSTDLLGWLVRRLGMPYAEFHATADPYWGNAVLSRVRLDRVIDGALPRVGTLLGRGVLLTEVTVGDADVTVMVTHLHHQADNLADVHRAQLTEVLSMWRQRPHTVLLGDFNAVPGSAAIEQIASAGFTDAWQRTDDPGYTSYAADPSQRIDYIFHTPDLLASDTRVIVSQASDHFAIVSQISLAGAP